MRAIILCLLLGSLAASLGCSTKLTVAELETLRFLSERKVALPLEEEEWKQDKEAFLGALRKARDEATHRQARLTHYTLAVVGIGSGSVAGLAKREDPAKIWAAVAAASGTIDLLFNLGAKAERGEALRRYLDIQIFDFETAWPSYGAYGDAPGDWKPHQQRIRKGIRTIAQGD